MLHEAITQSAVREAELIQGKNEARNPTQNAQNKYAQRSVTTYILVQQKQIAEERAQNRKRSQENAALTVAENRAISSGSRERERETKKIQEKDNTKKN